MLRNKVTEEDHLETHGGLREDIGTKTYLHGYAKMLKLRFRVGNLDLPERRKGYTSSQKEQDVNADVCPCGTTIE